MFIQADFLIVKARFHRRILSRQLNAIFVAKLNQVLFSMQFVAAISQGFRTCLKLDATKLHRAGATKIACVNGPKALVS